jgi:hypothetical protein
MGNKRRRFDGEVGANEASTGPSISVRIFFAPKIPAALPNAGASIVVRSPEFVS